MLTIDYDGLRRVGHVTHGFFPLFVAVLMILGKRVLEQVSLLVWGIILWGKEYASLQTDVLAAKRSAKELSS